MIDGALDFDGNNDYVGTVDDPLDLTGSLTLASWVYHTGSGTVQHISSKNDPNGSCPWQLSLLTSSRLRSYSRGNSQYQIIDSTDSVPLNGWHHVALVRDASSQQLTFYIDGAQDSGGWRTYFPDRIAPNGIEAKIASRGDGSSNFYEGKIDDLRIYNRALSSAEILALYQTIPGGEMSVGIAAPIDGAVIEGTIMVEVEASSEAGIDRVELYKDGEFFAADTLPPYIFIWSTALEPNQQHSILAAAFDNTASSAYSEPITVTVNNPPVGTRPNIVMVVTDDQRWDTMQYMPLTNSLLYADSIRFTNAVAAVPLCCPSRASIFTGLYSHNHGIVDNMPPYGGAPLFDPSSTIATWLDDRGYRTGLFGKYLNFYEDIVPTEPIPPGWDEFNAFLYNNGNYYNYSLVENGVIVPYGAQPEEYATGVIAEKAVEFIQSSEPDEPVFVYLAPFAPHSSAGDPYSLPTPGPGDAGAYATLPPWRPASYNEADVSDKPFWVQELPLLSPSDTAAGDQFRIHQLESLLAVDRAVGELIDTLVETDRYDNTIFIYLSDNGISWGEHRWNAKKWCAYEECVRIPLWIRVPGIPGREDDSLINDIDLAPTLAEAAGAFPTSFVNGLSMIDLIEDPGAPWRTESYSEYISMHPAFGGVTKIFREIRTKTFVYTEYENGDREFYDLTIDPLQEENRVDDPAYADTILGLQKMLGILRDQ